MRIHVTGMENVKGQQEINAILDSMNYEIDNHKWTVTTQNYTNLKFEKYLESGSTLTVDQKPKANIPIVGTHNGRKVYIGDLDVQGNLVVKDLNLRDNITTSNKSWTTITSGPDGGVLEGDWWDSESYNVGIKTTGSLVEVKSIPNDIRDTRYGSTINNGISYTASGSTIDTRTYEKVDTSSYIAYPTYNVVVDGVVTETNKHVLDDWKALGNIEVFFIKGFPQITVTNAEACWAPNQVYALFKYEEIEYTSTGMLQMMWWKKFGSYEDYYRTVSAYPSTHGRSGYGIMIPSWRFISQKFEMECKVMNNNIYTRRLISEEFEGKNSGIVKVDVSYRI